ncbi:LacI family DNA-binding transcriptional regulator [Propionibacteriaceae bacterium G57]|uniref:LacI family DNA-binding transcriptional regulator n=1 Tax=Aestuariimicrobium sp. G57 TaxID=3418485 RepID=UPI003DA6F588
MAADSREPRQPTMDDVALAAGVSRTSVSRVFLGQSKVSRETIRRVREVADELGYVPNRIASGLASGGSSTVGLLLRDAANPAYGLLFTRLQREAHEAGLDIISMTIAEDHRGHKQVAALDHLIGMQVSALIVATGGVTSDQLDPFRSRLPIIRAGRPEPTTRVHAVSYDEVDAGHRLGSLVTGQGHRRVAVLHTEADESYPEWVRATAITEALGAGGAEVVTLPVRRVGDQVEAAVDLAARGTVSAIMCPSDARALDVLRALQGRGLSAPDDVSVTGCDGIMPGLDLIGLTTFRVAVEHLAHRAITNLVGLLSGDIDSVVHEEVAGTLVPGRTSGPHHPLEN